MLETAWESRWLPGSFKRNCRVLAEGRMYLENCTQKKLSLITTSDSIMKNV